MNNFLLQSLMNSLKMKNPSGYNIVNTAMQNNGNPQQMLQQIMVNATPEQRESILKQAKSYRMP